MGSSVAIDSGLVIAGALQADTANGANSGSAHLFAVGGACSVATPYCFCDAGPAPCGNLGGTGEGCANSTGAGVILDATGSASVGSADLLLSATQLPPGPGLYFQGTQAVNGGMGNLFGDGLLCAGGPIIRLGVAFSSAGASSYPSGAQPSIAATGGASAGDMRFYQLWYRDIPGPCGASFNTSNARPTNCSSPGRSRDEPVPSSPLGGLRARADSCLCIRARYRWLDGATDESVPVRGAIQHGRGGHPRFANRQLPSFCGCRRTSNGCCHLV